MAFTPIVSGTVMSSTGVNLALGELDALIGSLSGLPTTPADSLAGAIGATALGTTATTISGAIAEIAAEVGTAIAAVSSDATNIAAGVAALGSVSTGVNNVAHGVSALTTTTSGSNNTALGYNALITGNGSGNVALGYQAGYFETTNDNFYVSTVAGSNAASGREHALMYGKFNPDPTSQFVNVNGRLGAMSWGFVPIDPPDPPTIASISAGGLVDLGVHQYAVTYVTSAGETGFSDYSATATPSGGNRTVNLSAIPTSASSLVTARRIYRTKIADIALGHSNFLYLVATINDNTTQVYTDAAADSAIAALPSQFRDNSTTGRIYHGSILSGVLGPSNTSWGLHSMEAITAGFDNTALGTTALQAITSGYNNVGVGRGALAALTAAHNNTAIGTHALQDKVTGEYNTALGVNALRFNTSSDYNTALGANALIANISGTQNTAVGWAALSSALGNGNIALGSYAGFWETGSNHVFIDAFARTNEADGRASALIHGTTDAVAANQTLALNANVTMNYRFGTLKADGANNAQFLIDSNAQSGGRVRVRASAGANTPEVYMTLLGVGGTPYGEIAVVDTAGWRNLVLCEAGGNVMIGTATDGMTASGSLAVAEDLAHRGTKTGFYNTTPIVKQTGVAVTAGAIHAALVNLGLIAA